MALSHSWHIGIDGPPRSEQASQVMTATEMIFALLLVLVRVPIDDDDASLTAELSSLDCSCCANRPLGAELDIESESRRRRGVRDGKSDMATDDPFFFFVPRGTREFVVVGAR